MRTSHGLMALSGIEIKRSDRSEQSGAHMVAGRLFGDTEIARIWAAAR